ncbi:hypothetical protein KA089_01685 [Candidatus Woesebacteria bacterium]|nr:hypothetical protein [Candidatus Woesebacteria bacterium]
MNEKLSPRAQEFVNDFEKTEPVLVGRLLLKLTKFINKEKYIAGRNFYAYIRHIDDIVYEGKDPDSTKLFLREEMAFLESLIENNFKIPNNLDPYRELLIQGFENTTKKTEIATNLINGIKAFYLDTLAIKYSKPIPEDYRTSRNSLTLLPYLETLSLILFNRSFTGKENPKEFDQILTAWVELDALRDYPEDLPAGLVIFSKNDLEKDIVKLEVGEKVPQEFNELHKRLKLENIKRILENLSSLNKSDLPIAVRLAFQLYFLRGILKLLRMESMGDTEIIFAVNQGLK